MKKIVIRILTVIAVSAMLIIGKIQMDKYRVKSIMHGEEGKAAIENMLKIMDEKAFTMGGVIVRVIINDDPELDVETTLNKYPSRGKLEHGVILRSQKMAKLVPPKGKLNAESNKGNE